MKKMLMVATVPSMIGQFNMNNIQLLQEMGYEVHVACDFTDRSVWTEERVTQFEETLEEKDIQKYQVDFSRSALRIDRHIASYRQLKQVIKQNNYNFVHCHTPIAGAISRFVCKNTKMKCIYTAHGFHFYKGAPLKNWLLFYPIEWICSWMTDVLITINKEDYNRAKKCLHAKKTEYVPGVGVDLRKFGQATVNKSTKRRELGIPEDSILLLSVGELNENKNHETVIRAIKDLDVYYIIAGKGDLREYLEKVIDEIGLTERIKLLGFRRDVSELYQAADIYVLPSVREGLNVSIMEAMASGLPAICSKIRGNIDLIKDEDCLFHPGSVSECSNAIDTIRKRNLSDLISDNLKMVQSFDIRVVQQKMDCIYRRRK